VSDGACPLDDMQCQLWYKLYISDVWNHTKYWRTSEKCEAWMEIAVGVARRDLPLFSSSCISHTPRASVEVGAAQRVMGHHHYFHPLFFFFFEWVGRAVPVPVPVAAEVEGDWDPSVKRTVERTAGKYCFVR
jgi:hypothetical protein